MGDEEDTSRHPDMDRGAAAAYGALTLHDPVDATPVPIGSAPRRSGRPVLWKGVSPRGFRFAAGRYFPATSLDGGSALPGRSRTSSVQS